LIDTTTHMCVCYVVASKANTVYTIRSESGIEIQGTLQNPGEYYGFSVQRSIVITTTEDVEVSSRSHMCHDTS